jgi:ATP-dependent RNA helicase HelY
VSALDYVSGLPFAPDDFQREAAAAIDAGASVVVSAPTGSGKTVVAEAAVARALERGERAVYTTPIKALSNQKFGDFRSSHGPDRVGLLTGDNTINPRADIVVMTTEVLRNMMYADSEALEAVGVAILDEVHYLQDRERGGVWEEIIVHLDPAIALVCLSATVANADEFAAWVAERRGATELIVTAERPVPLESTYLVRDRWERGRLHMHPVSHDGRPNERLARMLRSGRARYGTPRRHETCELLRRSGLLPAIYFIFSRAGCAAAVDTVVDRGLQLTSATERAEIAATVEQRVAGLAPDDLTVLGYDRWLRGLMAGVASHHAGLVPVMKETVEELFSGGLVRLVFATETLALGINMPARTVVLESLSKFTGEGHEMLRPGDYTQLTGRAGRRGIDTEGTAVILHSPYLDFERAAGIAAQGSHPLQSSFRPTYNMAVNLVAIYDRPTAEALLEASFAGFRERRRAREVEERAAANSQRLAELREAAQAGGPSVWAEADRSPPSRLSIMAEFADSLRAGDVLEGLRRGPAGLRHVVIARSIGTHPRLVTVDSSGRLHRIAAAKLPDEVSVVGRLEIPAPRRSGDPAFRQRVVALLEAFTPDPEDARGVDTPGPAVERGAVEAARAALRLERRMARDRDTPVRADRGLVQRFHALTALLQERGYVDGWALTDRGERLRRIYSRLDLVLGESLDAGLFDGLDGPRTAALASAFTFEPRRDPVDASWPDGIADRGAGVERIWAEVVARERQLGLPETPAPEPGFSGLAARWAGGERLGRLFDSESDVGDFVRTCRQLIDVLRQISESAHPRAPGVEAAIVGVDRGVVAALGVL